MWMGQQMSAKRQQMYKVDLTKIEGNGDFSCPRCGALISPDDESEEVYTIVDTKMKGDTLEELIITCNKCGSKIHIVGFVPQ
jgi:ribosomal protein S27AE